MPTRILIVDDSPRTREELREALNDPRYEIVGEAKDGEEAIRMFRVLNPDLVLMDIVMPKMNGTQSAREILLLDGDAKIISVSGLAQPSIMIEAEVAGMVGSVTKPIEKVELIAEIEAALS